MLAVGQSINIYKIKEILSEEADHTCCLTDDPFFNRTILLKVYPVDTLQNRRTSEDFEAQIEALFHLEHRSIAPVFDSGFADDYFYFTTNYDYIASLQDSTIEELTSELILEWIREIAGALAYAVGAGFIHGHLSPDDLFIGAQGQVVIADFGVKYQFGAQSVPEWTEAEILADLGRLQLQLLQPVGSSVCGDEEELLEKIENVQIRQVIERTFPITTNCYKTIDEMLSDINEIMAQPQEETISTEPKGEPLPTDEAEISIDERELVLPHVRELIAEKKHYHDLFEKGAIENNKLEGQLRQAYQALDEATQLQLAVPKKPIGRVKLSACLIVSFILGAVLAGSYGDQDSVVVPVIADEVAKKQVPAKINTAVILPKAEVPIAKTIITTPSESQEIISKKVEIPAATQLIAEPSPVWLPAGSEFTPSVNIEPLTKYDSTVIINVLTDWANSWSQQDAATYFKHYSDSYNPAPGVSREEWLTNRTARLQRPEWIKVEISNIRLRKMDDKRVQAKFQQEFLSNTYHDKINKSINMIPEKGDWKIVTERSLGVITE